MAKSLKKGAGREANLRQTGLPLARAHRYGHARWGLPLWGRAVILGGAFSVIAITSVIVLTHRPPALSSTISPPPFNSQQLSPPVTEVVANAPAPSEPAGTAAMLHAQ